MEPQTGTLESTQEQSRTGLNLWCTSMIVMDQPFALFYLLFMHFRYTQYFMSHLRNLQFYLKKTLL